MVLVAAVVSTVLCVIGTVLVFIVPVAGFALLFIAFCVMSAIPFLAFIGPAGQDDEPQRAADDPGSSDRRFLVRASGGVKTSFGQPPKRRRR